MECARSQRSPNAAARYTVHDKKDNKLCEREREWRQPNESAHSHSLWFPFPLNVVRTAFESEWWMAVVHHNSDGNCKTPTHFNWPRSRAQYVGVRHGDAKGAHKARASKGARSGWHIASSLIKIFHSPLPSIQLLLLSFSNGFFF